MAHPTGPQYPYQQYPQGPRSPQGLTAAGKVGVGCAGVLLAGLLMLVMLVGCAALLSGGNSSGSPAPVTTLSPTQEPTEASEDEPAEEPVEEESEEESTEEPEEDHPGLGDTVEHGDWEITVHSIDYDVPASDLDPYFSDEPSGQWVAVEMSVTNLSSGPERFSGNDQVLMDAEGSMYRYDLWASDLFGGELNPGTDGDGRLAYDVPEDFEADHMLVNGEGHYADGVRVELD